MVNNKPVVTFRKHVGDNIIVGQRAMLYGGVHNHPNVDGSGMVNTSPVIRVFDGGFETQNTVYHAVE